MKSKFIHSILFSIAFLAFAITDSKAGNAEPPGAGYVINGTVKGLDNAWVKLVEVNIVDRQAAKVLDSVHMQNGSFKFKGKVSHIDRVMLSLDSKYYCEFILENSPVNIELDISESTQRDGRLEPKITGSKSQTLFELQRAKSDSIRNQAKYAPLIELRTELEKAYQSKDEELINSFKKKAEGLSALTNEQQEEYRNSLFQFVKNNPASPVSPYVLGFQFSEGRMTKEELKTYYKVFEGAAKETAMFKYYAKTYTEIFETLGIGATAPDFELTNVDGQQLKLSVVKGKYILVDFWASWCVPCRASFPHLKELYAKYKNDGFEVLAVGTADEEAKWRKAIEVDKTVWNHVYDNSANHAYGKVAKMFGVPFLPTTFLVDENRVIVGRNLGQKELDAKLKTLFGY